MNRAQQLLNGYSDDVEILIAVLSDECIREEFDEDYGATEYVFHDGSVVRMSNVASDIIFDHYMSES